MRNSSRSHGAGAAEPRRRAKGRKMADVRERWSIRFAPGPTSRAFWRIPKQWKLLSLMPLVGLLKTVCPDGPPSASFQIISLCKNGANEIWYKMHQSHFSLLSLTPVFAFIPWLKPSSSFSCE